MGSFEVGPEPGIYEMDVDPLPSEQIQPDASGLFRSRPGFTGSPDATEAGMPGVAYRWMEVDGPVKDARASEGFRRLFGNLAALWDNKGHLSVTPSAPGDAERLLRQFMPAAYRRPPREEEVQRYLGIIQAQLGKHVPFADAMIAGYSRCCVLRGFIYLEARPGRLDAYALASRLSYFLRNCLPDAELRRLAANGRLLTIKVPRCGQSRRIVCSTTHDHEISSTLFWTIGWTYEKLTTTRQIRRCTPIITLTIF